ncbi:MAG: Ig-like domain-containing protein [Planctomycetia bacterium]
MRRQSKHQGARSCGSRFLSGEVLEPRRVCAAGLTLALVRDTGSAANDGITSDPTLTIGTPLAAGQRVEYRINGSVTRTAVMADARRFVPEGVGADGRYWVAARLVDAAGKSMPFGPALTFQVDRAAAPLRVALRQDTGASPTDRITSIGDLVVSGQERNGTVQYSRDNGTWNPATAVWGGYAPQPGLNRWRVRQIDVAGNASTPVVIAFDLDAARDERVVRIEGPRSGSFEARAGQRISWTLEFEKPMYVSAAGGTLPGLRFTFRDQTLTARCTGGSGTKRLEYTFVVTAQQAGQGTLAMPTHVCLCYGGLISDAAGNRLAKHELPVLTIA